MPDLDKSLLQRVLLRQLLADAEQVLRAFQTLPRDQIAHVSGLIEEFRRLLEEFEKLLE